MASISSVARFILAFVLFAVVIEVCDAGEYCLQGTYCATGCCDEWRGECCSSTVALVVGLCVGGGVLIFTIIIIFCICRRRRMQGVVYRSNPNNMVVTQVNTAGGVVTTAGVQPGYAYPPGQHMQPVGPYGQTPYTPYGPGQQYGQPYPQPQPTYAAGPPSYDAVAGAPPAGYGQAGVDNPAFTEKQ